MRKSLMLLMVVACTVYGDLKIESLKWTNDYEMLVKLNMKVENDIVGLDINHNGIRDDVEYYVEQKYKSDPFEKEIFLESAKKIQTILSLSDNTPLPKRVQLDNELIELYTCRDYMLYKLDVADISSKMKEKLNFKSRVLNTNDRLRAYIEHKKKVLDFGEEDIAKMEVDSKRIACENRYKSLMNPDLVTSK